MAGALGPMWAHQDSFTTSKRSTPLRRLVVGAMVTTAVLAAAAFAIAQITNGVPSPQPRGNYLASADTLLAGGWDAKILATGLQKLENPVGIFTNYGYLNDTGAAPANCANYTAQTSGIKTKTEPDQNTYVVTASNPGGPANGFDYGRHFLYQGHELFSAAGSGVGQTNSAYLTRINLDVPTYDPHRITLLGFTGGADNCNTGMASIDGSTYNPFTGSMLFTGEAGGSSAASTSYGGVYSTPVNWASTTAPVVEHTSLQQSFGHAGYEGIQIDDHGNVVVLEDTGGSTVSSNIRRANSYVFRFVPTNPANLTVGVLQALKVSVDGTPLTFASQDPVAGTADKRLYSGETLQAQWVTVHDSTVVGPPANFDANAEAQAAGATPFKRPENGRFVPDTGFKSYAFTVTGDTNANAITAQTPNGQTWADRGAAGAIMQIDMPTSGANTATIRAIVPGDFEHNSYDSLTFLDKDTVMTGEDRGDTLHSQLNALDSTHAFDLTQPFSKRLETGQRLVAQGRDAEATEDVARKEGPSPAADQNDGDNEITGLLVSNGASTTIEPFGTSDPAKLTGTRVFFTGQHGANITYELIPPGLNSSKTSPTVIGPQGPQGQDGQAGQNGQNGANGTNGAAGPAGPAGAQGAQGAAGRDGRDGLTILCTIKGKRVSCKPAKASSVRKASAARLVRYGRTYAKGKLSNMRKLRSIRRDVRYTLVVGKGKSARHLAVRFG